jgi:hypothetical protein
VSATTRALLRSKRAKVLKAAKAAIKASQKAANAPNPGRANIAAEVHTLQSSLAALHAQLHAQTDPKSKAAAAALVDLGNSLAKLRAASVAKTPKEASALLVAGYRQLAAAEEKAKAAGNAWGL